MDIPLIDEKQLFDKLQTQSNPHFEEYYAFYSSWFGGIIKNPRMMMLPIDDHMVHRGDGVFEAMKAVSRAVYLMEEHLTRLFLSAEKIALKIPFSAAGIKEIILETLRQADVEDAVIRLYISRGPGSFSANPYDSIGPQVYVAVTKLHPPAAQQYINGVTLGISEIPVKSDWLTQVKSCNYLPNVMMKKEAVDRGIDYVIGIDKHGNLTESSTENIMMVDQDGKLIHPPLSYILKGTIMTRSFELARKHGIPTEIRPISISDLQTASEVMIAGTTLNILPAVEFEGRKIGNGRPGPIANKLLALILEDIKTAHEKY